MSTEQWQLYVKNLRAIKIDQENLRFCWVNQLIVLGEVKAEDPLQNENPMNDQIIWQQYIQQVESLSPENKVSKFCKEAGFMRVVEVGQYFVTKDTGDFRQFQSVACREYTLPRDDPASQAKGWIQGNMRIGPVLEVTTSFQHFKYGIEIRIESVNKDSSHFWVRISYGTVKYVVDSIQDNTGCALYHVSFVSQCHENDACYCSYRVPRGGCSATSGKRIVEPRSPGFYGHRLARKPFSFARAALIRGFARRIHVV